MLQVYLMMLQDEKDKDKFTLIYNEYQKMIYSAAFKIVANHHLAEEIVQDTLLKIVKNIYKIEDVKDKVTRNYIYTIAKHTAFDVINIENKFCETFDEKLVKHNEQLITPDILDLVVSDEGYQKLSRIVERLNDTYKETLRLKLIFEYSNEEIAKIQGISKRAVEMRLHRGRIIIKELLGQERDNYAIK